MTLEELRDWHLQQRDEQINLEHGSLQLSKDPHRSLREKALFKMAAQKYQMQAQMHQDAADALSEALIRRG